jgi:hypothetical protein
MQYPKLSLAVCLFALTIACKRPDPIHLQPTIEQSPTFSSSVKIGERPNSDQLLRGFYSPGREHWCWVAPKFAVAFATPPGASMNGAWVVLDFTLPDVSVAALKQITISARTGSTALPAETFSTAGDHTYRHDVPASAFKEDLVGVNFTVDKFITPPDDGRDLALVVHAVSLEAK